MLAISRALLLNPRLLVMDEPTEGLAPVIVEQVEQMLRRYRRTGRHRRPGRRTEHRRRDGGGGKSRDHDQRPGQPDHGSGAARGGPRSAAAAARRRPAWRRGGAAGRGAAEAATGAAENGRRPATPRGPIRVYISNPVLPTRWSQPVPVAQIESAARTRTVAPEPAAIATAPAVDLRPLHRGGTAPVIVAGTLDTKGAELRFIRDQIAAAGVRVVLVDLSTSGGPSPADVPPHHVAAYYPRRTQCGVHRRPRRRDHRHGGGVRSLDPAARAGRRPDLGRRLRRLFAGRAGDARAADRRAEGADFDGRLRQRRALCRPRRHHDALFGHRRRRTEFDERARCCRTARRRWSAWSRRGRRAASANARRYGAAATGR